MMKRLGLISLLVIAFVNVWGQSNVKDENGNTTPINVSGSNVGIGTTIPETKLHVTSMTSGDAIFKIEADTDNNNESDNPLILFRQDGGTLGVNVGFDENKFGCNIFGISRKYSNNEFFDGLFLNTANGRVGIGQKYPHSKLHVVGGILSDDPNITEDWNTIWQSGFFEGYNNTNAPEASQWFWGINMNHSSNHPDYRYGGQILVRNNSLAPTMYFRSRTKDGTGVWAKVIHDQGDQRIEGNLTINGQVISEEIEVKEIAANNITVKANGNTADFVFSVDYTLKSLTEVENYIKTHKHLPDIPSAEAMEKQGVNLAEMNKLLLQKVEELTLYTIEKDKEVKELKEEQQKETEELKERLAKLEALLMK